MVVVTVHEFYRHIHTVHLYAKILDLVWNFTDISASVSYIISISEVLIWRILILG